MDYDPGLVAFLCESPHFLQGHTFLDVLENLLITAFVADQEQPESAIFQELDSVRFKICAAVTAPGQTKWSELCSDFARARQVCREGVIVAEEVLHLREEAREVSHLVRDILSRANTVLVSADCLRPQTERALRRATAAGVKTDVRML